MTALLISDARDPSDHMESKPAQIVNLDGDMEIESSNIAIAEVRRTTSDLSLAAEGTETHQGPCIQSISTSDEEDKDTSMTLETFLWDNADDQEEDGDSVHRTSLSSDDADVEAPVSFAAPPLSMQHLKLSNSLGTGASGAVFRAHLDSTGPDVAVKVFQRGKRANFQCEEHALQVVGDHPNVISLLGSLALADTSDFLAGESGPQASEMGRQSVLVLELCGQGDMCQLVERAGALPFSVARTYAHTLWRALGACHDRHVYHRDVKLENIFLADDWSCRLADFGFAFVGAPPKLGLTDSRGTKGYMSPEVLSGKNHDPGQADVWAMGVATFILFMGHPPFYSADTSCWYYRTILTKKWNRFWEAHERVGPILKPMLKKFLQRCFTIDFRLRPTVAQLLKDSWLAKPPLSPEALAGAMQSVVGGLSQSGDITIR